MLSNSFLLNRRAFTVLEITTVLAISAILTVVLLLVANRAFEASRNAKCIANLRQIAAGTLAFASDNDGRFPPNVAQKENGAILTFVDYIDPYLHNNSTNTSLQSVWRCPSATHRRSGYTLPDYSANERLSSDDYGVFSRQAFGRYFEQVRASQVQNPSKLIMFLDSFTNGDPLSGTWLNGTRFDAGTLLWTRTDRFGTALGSDGPAPRHFHSSTPTKGYFNVAYCDGHVASLSWTDPELRKPDVLLDLTTTSK